MVHEFIGGLALPFHLAFDRLIEAGSHPLEHEMMLKHLTELACFPTQPRAPGVYYDCRGDGNFSRKCPYN